VFTWHAIRLHTHAQFVYDYFNQYRPYKIQAAFGERAISAIMSFYLYCYILDVKQE